MNIETSARDSVASHPDPPILQFVAFEVLPIAGGQLRISSSGTYLDEGDLEFMTDGVETFCVATIDEAVSVIRRSLTDALKAHVQKEH